MEARREKRTAQHTRRAEKEAPVAARAQRNHLCEKKCARRLTFASSSCNNTQHATAAHGQEHNGHDEHTLNQHTKTATRHAQNTEPGTNHQSIIRIKSHSWQVTVTYPHAAGRSLSLESESASARHKGGAPAIRDWEGRSGSRCHRDCERLCSNHAARQQADILGLSCILRSDHQSVP